MISCHFSVLLCLLLLTSPIALASVFLRHKEANNVLQRTKRANYFLEELKAASLERECLEEKCSWEEAREIFQDDLRTNQSFLACQGESAFFWHPNLVREWDANCVLVLALADWLKQANGTCVQIQCCLKPVAEKKEFWTIYSDPDQCDSNPCQNNATCIDRHQNYFCICPLNYEGRNCEIGPESKLKCFYKNGNCQQFCVDSPTTSRQCFCAEGYRLASDQVSCIPEVDYPCGNIPILAKKSNQRGRIVGGFDCPPGECPWQALITDRRHEKCGGVLVAPSWIITAAHCLEHVHQQNLRIKLGEYRINQKDEGEQERGVAEVIIHEKYSSKKVDNDIALLRLAAPVNFSEYVVPICLPPPRFAADVLNYIEFSTVSGWGRLLEGGATSAILMRVQIPKIHKKECIRHTKFNITDNMFCAGYLNGTKDSCEGDSGGPHVTEYRNTWYLTGLVSWGKGCAALGTYGVYTKVLRYFQWLNNHMDS